MKITRYHDGETVEFKFNGEINKGKIWTVDVKGTFEQSHETSYDIYVEEEKMMYKHVLESCILRRFDEDHDLKILELMNAVSFLNH